MPEGYRIEWDLNSVDLSLKEITIYGVTLPTEAYANIYLDDELILNYDLIANGKLTLEQLLNIFNDSTNLNISINELSNHIKDYNNLIYSLDTIASYDIYMYTVATISYEARFYVDGVYIKKVTFDSNNLDFEYPSLDLILRKLGYSNDESVTYNVVWEPFELNSSSITIHGHLEIGLPEYLIVFEYDGVAVEKTYDGNTFKDVLIEEVNTLFTPKLGYRLVWDFEFTYSEEPLYVTATLELVTYYIYFYCGNDRVARTGYTVLNQNI